MPSQSKRRNRVIYGLLGYMAGFAIGMAAMLLIDTTFEVGMLVGFGSTMIGLLLGLAAA
jgi:hypothetical protein